MVDGVDLTVWRSGVGVPAAAATTASQMLVPEPDHVWLAILGGAIVGLRRFLCGHRVARREFAEASSRQRRRRGGGDCGKMLRTTLLCWSLAGKLCRYC